MITRDASQMISNKRSACKADTDTAQPVEVFLNDFSHATLGDSAGAPCCIPRVVVEDYGHQRTEVTNNVECKRRDESHSASMKRRSSVYTHGNRHSRLSIDMQPRSIRIPLFAALVKNQTLQSM
jgi:hypothetical protein